MIKQKNLESKPLSILLFIFLFTINTVMFMTKNMFSSAMATIVEEGFMTKSQTGFINAAFWFVYAIFQFAGGFLADKFKSRNLILIGIGGSVIANLIIYLNQSYPVIIAAWAFNAMIQFGVWPGIFKIASTELQTDIQEFSVFWLMFSTSVGLFLSMLVASFVKRWQQNFLISAITLLVMLVLFFIVYHFLEKKMVESEAVLTKQNEKTVKTPILKLTFTSGLIVFFVLCMLRGSVDNGIKMLTPVMLMESYDNLPAAISTRISSVLILFSTLGLLLSGLVHSKISRNELKAQAVIYPLALIPLVFTLFVGKIHYIIIFIALSLAVTLIHSGSSFILSYAPLRFIKTGRTGTISGILNAMAAAGNIFASYGFAKMAEIFPWNYVTAIFISIIAICFLLSLIFLPCWSRFIKK